MKVIKSNQIFSCNKEVKVEYTGEEVRLSSRRKQEIEKFWLDVNKEQQFLRGDTFTIQSIVEQDDVMNIKLSLTDYAHYLHTVRHHITDQEGCKVVYGAGLIETKDGQFVIGKMASHTAYPDRLQCAGGGLGWEDITGRYFNVENSVLREVNEEFGIEHDTIEQCTPIYLMKTAGYDHLVILFHIKIQLVARELLEDYQRFATELISQGEKPEFQEVIFVEKKRDAVERLFEENVHHAVDYLYPFLMKMVDDE